MSAYRNRAPGYVALAAALILSAVAGTRAAAYPMFARTYHLPCARCHDMAPRLTPFGYAFFRAGFRLTQPIPKPTNIANYVSFVSTLTAQHVKGSGASDISIPEIDSAMFAPLGNHVTVHVHYIFGTSNASSSGLDETWVQYNTAARGSFWSVRVGQMPVLDGYQLLGDREVTTTDASLFGSSGPLTADTVGNFGIAGLERGVEVGYTDSPFDARISWLQGVDESGDGATGIEHGGYNDFALQSDYLIGNQGSSVGAFYYHGSRALPSVGFTNRFSRAGLFGTFSKMTKPGKFGIPALHYELNGGLLWGQDTVDASGTSVNSYGGLLEGDVYFHNQTALVARYDSVKSADVAGTPVTEALTFGVQHRFNQTLQVGAEYRKQHGPGDESLIGTVMFTF